MTRLYKIFFWLVCIAIPAVIAACYGSPYRYNPRGHVMDAGRKVQRDGHAVRPDGRVREMDLKRVDVDGPDERPCECERPCPAGDRRLQIARTSDHRLPYD